MCIGIAQDTFLAHPEHYVAFVRRRLSSVNIFT